MTPLIELESINFFFPKHNIPLFENINLKIFQSDSIALVGQNGTGKSTLMKILATLLRPNHGSYYFSGETIENKMRELRSIINYIVGGTLGFYPRLSAVENLVFFSGLKGNMLSNHDAKNILLRVGLKQTDLDKKFFKFSLGMKQRMHLAKLFLSPCELILIDEPTNGLDVQGQEIFIEVLNQDLKYKTKVIIAHDEKFLSKVTSKLVRIENGKLF